MMEDLKAYEEEQRRSYIQDMERKVADLEGQLMENTQVLFGLAKDLEAVNATLDRLGVPEQDLPASMRSEQYIDPCLAWRLAWLLGREEGRKQAPVQEPADPTPLYPGVSVSDDVAGISILTSCGVEPLERIQGWITDKLGRGPMSTHGVAKAMGINLDQARDALAYMTAKREIAYNDTMGIWGTVEHAKAEGWPGHE